MKRAYANIREGQIHYRIEGDGEPVLLLHAATNSSDEFTRVMPFLSKKYCIIAPDFMGNGDSDPAPYQYQVSDHARIVVSFIDALGIKKVSMVGQHIGAKIAVDIATTWPERVKSLVLSSLGYYPDKGEGKPVQDPPNFTTQVEIKPDGSHLMEWWRKSAVWGDPVEVVEERLIEYVKAGPRGEEIHWSGRTYDVKPKLPLIKCPTLVLSATYDPFFEAAERIHNLVPGSDIAIIKNGPMHVDRLMPKEFAETILSFLHTLDNRK